MKEKEKITIEANEKKRIISELLENGYAITNIDILDNKLKTVFRTITIDEQLEASKFLSQFKDEPSTYVIGVYKVRLLAYALMSYNGTDVSKDKIEDKTKRLREMPTVIIDSLSQKFDNFVTTVKAVVNGEEIDKAFFEQESIS